MEKEFKTESGRCAPSEDIITIHLGVELTDEQYKEVVDSVVAFMNKRWPQFMQSNFSN